MTDLDAINQKYNDLEYINFYISHHMKTFPNLHNVNGLLFPFDPNCKNIGITFSGGVDSSLLLYILCNLIEKTNSNCRIHVIHFVRFFKSKWWIENIAKNIYDYFKQKFPDIIQDFNIGLIPEDFETVKISTLNKKELDNEFKADLSYCDVLIVRRYEEFYQYKLNLDFIYGGTTCNPPIEHEQAPKFRQIDNIGKTLKESVGSYLIHPFYFVMKDWVLAQYYNYDIENILEMTRSCSADSETLGEEWKDYKDAVPPVCGNCFFCKEKQWGMKNKDRFLIK